VQALSLSTKKRWTGKNKSELKDKNKMHQLTHIKLQLFLKKHSFLIFLFKPGCWTLLQITSIYRFPAHLQCRCKGKLLMQSLCILCRLLLQFPLLLTMQLYLYCSGAGYWQRQVQQYILLKWIIPQLQTAGLQR